MDASTTPRYCRCGTLLARDNVDKLCAACRAKARDQADRPPEVPAEFWATDQMRDALETWHIGRVIAAYRHHPFHGQVLRQELVAAWMGITQAQLSRIETGQAVRDLDKLVQWAQLLRIPAGLLWFKLPDRPSPEDEAAEAGRPEPAGRSTLRLCEIDEMNRRELLRLLSVSGTLLAAPAASGIDGNAWGQLDGRGGPLDSTTVEHYAEVNAQLWRTYAAAKPKSHALPLVRAHLDVVTKDLQRSLGPTL